MYHECLAEQEDADRLVLGREDKILDPDGVPDQSEYYISEAQVPL